MAALATAGTFAIRLARRSLRRSIGFGLRVVTGTGNGSGNRPWTWTARHERPSAVAVTAPEVGKPSARSAALASASGTSAVNPRP